MNWKQLLSVVLLAAALCLQGGGQGSLGICSIALAKPPTTSALPTAPTATVNARDLSQITNDSVPVLWPRPSPDGKKLLFCVYDASQKEYWGSFAVVVTTLGQPGRQIIVDRHARDASWMADGQHILYSDVTVKRFALARASIDPRGTSFVLPNPFGKADTQPVVSPDGKRIAFGSDVGDSWRVCTVNADGSQPTAHIEGASPQWHPNGQQLVFDRWVGKNVHIYTLDLPTGRVTQLTTGKADNQYPMWSPKGDSMVFVSNRDGRYHLYVMNSDGSALRQLTAGPAEECFPAWSSDGAIYFTSNAGAPTRTNAKPWRWTYSNIWRLRPTAPQ